MLRSFFIDAGDKGAENKYMYSKIVSNLAKILITFYFTIRFIKND